jgi:integrase/recombinase XerC
MPAKRPPAVPTYRSAQAQHQLDLEIGSRAETTRKWYKLVTTRYLAYLLEQQLIPDADSAPITCLTLEQARTFMVWVKETPAVSPRTGSTVMRSPKTLHAHAKALKAFSSYCHEQGLLSTNVLQGLKLPKVVERVMTVLTGEQIKAILQVIEHRPLRDRNLAIVYFMLATGVRVAELCRLQLQDVDLKGKRAKVLGKGNKERYVEFDAVTAKLLVRWSGQRPETLSRELFLTWQGTPLTEDGMRHLFTVWGLESGLGKQGVRLTPHLLRHCFATTYLENHPGALFHLQALLGHTNLSVTHIYAKVAAVREPLEGPSVVDRLGIARLVR